MGPYPHRPRPGRIGETFFGPAAVSSYIHESVSGYLLGKDPLLIDRHSRMLLNPILGYSSSGVEMRGTSAIDIALWDLFGQASNQPIHQMLGGLSRDRIRIYNTCGGYLYGRGGRVHNSTSNWGTGATGPYEDLDAFMHRADELAESLLAQGITGMKSGRSTPPPSSPTDCTSPAPTCAAAGAIRQNPQSSWRPHGHHGGDAFAVEPAHRQAHRPGA